MMITRIIIFTQMSEHLQSMVIEHEEQRLNSAAYVICLETKSCSHSDHDEPSQEESGMHQAESHQETPAPAYQLSIFWEDKSLPLGPMQDNYSPICSLGWLHHLYGSCVESVSQGQPSDSEGMSVEADLDIEKEAPIPQVTQGSDPSSLGPQGSKGRKGRKGPKGSIGRKGRKQGPQSSIGRKGRKKGPKGSKDGEGEKKGKSPRQTQNYLQDFKPFHFSYLSELEKERKKDPNRAGFSKHQQTVIEQLKKGNKMSRADYQILYEAFEQEFIRMLDEEYLEKKISEKLKGKSQNEQRLKTYLGHVFIFEKLVLTGRLLHVNHVRAKNCTFLKDKYYKWTS